MLFGLIRDEERVESHDSAHTTLPALYDRAGNLEVELESLAKHHPLTLMPPEQIRAYNHILEQAKEFLPDSVVLKEDAFLIEEGDIAHVAAFYHVLHTAIVPTLHNALPEDVVR